MRREAALAALDDAPPIALVNGAGVSRTVPLSAVSEVRVSNVDKKSEPGELPVRLCNYTHVYKNDYITDDLEFMRATASSSEIARFGLRAGDVIITKDSETPDDIGIPSLVDEVTADLVCGYHLAMIRPSPDKVDPTFLAKQLAQPRIARYFGQQANGSTRYGLSIAAIERTPIWLPLMEQQQSVGRLARQLDVAITEWTDLISKLRQVRVGLVHDLLTRGIDSNGELRDPVRRPELFQDSALGTIPVSWTCSPLLETTDWYSGGTPSRSEASWWTGAIPFLTPKDMKQFVLSDTIEHLTPVAAISGSKLMDAEMVFIVVRGMILAHTFPVCISTQPFAFNQDIKAICSRGQLKNWYLAHWLSANADNFLRRATEATHGTKKLDRDEIARIYIAVPPPDEQDEIIRRIEQTDTHLALYSDELQKLEATRHGLLADLLTSPLKVRNAVQEVGAK